MRQDPLTGEWISIAAARQNRAFLPPDELDPLAPSAPGHATEVPDNYDVAVFENKSPAFGLLLPEPETNPGAALAELDTIGLGRSLPGVGRCEVVCFGPQRTGSWADFSVSPGAHRRRGVGRPHRRAVRGCPAYSRSTSSRTAVRRSASLCTTRTVRSTPIPYVTPRTRNLLASIGSYGPGAAWPTSSTSSRSRSGC